MFASNLNSILSFRALETLGLARFYHQYWSDLDFLHDDTATSVNFQPGSKESKYSYTFNTGRYFASWYSDLCIEKRQNSPYIYTDYLTSVGSASGTYGIKWPQVNDAIAVLIYVAESTVGSDTTDNVYWNQAKLYNSTLSPTQNSRLFICSECSHTFAYDENYVRVASQLSTFFSSL